MHVKRALYVLSPVLMIGLFLVIPKQLVRADTTEELSNIHQAIEQKKDDISDLNERISEYTKKIRQKEGEQASLSNQLDLLDNRIGKTTLEIESTNKEIDLSNAEILEIEQQIKTLQDQLDREKNLIINILQTLQIEDQNLPIKIFYGSQNFSELFDNLQRLEQLGEDLHRSVERAKASQNEFLRKKDDQIQKEQQLEDLKKTLEEEKQRLEDEAGAQTNLLVLTKHSESSFRALLTGLRQEQEQINNQVAQLQSEWQNKLRAGDTGQNSSQPLSWPLNPSSYGISARFHDPTYPFRNLFEHSGVDIPHPIGTTIKSAGPGYVAWTRRGGKQYGNYVMIIHDNGIATLYAHLSRMDVQSDQFVARGDSIGAVGMTGFTTGPHLHFEVRLNGIPVDPMNYLPHE